MFLQERLLKQDHALRIFGPYAALTCDDPYPAELLGPALPGVGTGGVAAWIQPISSGAFAICWSSWKRYSDVDISKSSKVRCSPRRARDLSPLGLHDSSPATIVSRVC